MDHKIWNAEKTVNAELERTEKETVLAYFKIPQCIPSGTDEHGEISQFPSCDTNSQFRFDCDRQNVCIHFCYL
jgi:hypothetical protein